jgi:hypothetical protein
VCYSAEQQIEFLRNGERVELISLKSLSEKVEPREQKIIEPHEEIEKIYLGFKPIELFQAIYGEKWKSGKKLIVKALDGFRTEIQIKRFKNKKGFFAFSEKGQKEFKIFKQNKKVPVGPLYLTWYGYKDAKSRYNDRHLKWPYQIHYMNIEQ